MAWQTTVRAPQEQRFRDLGVEVSGQIVALRKERRLRTKSRGARAFVVTTVFNSEDGVPRRFDDEVSRRTFHKLRVGDPIAVRYVPGRADGARITIREHRASPGQTFKVFAWIGGLSAVWLFATMIYGGRRSA